MRSMIGILTYRRVNALYEMLSGIDKHCPQYACVVSEDCGQRDATANLLEQGREPRPNKELMATEYVTGDDPLAAHFPNVRTFMGDRNLGVAASSNRLLKIFMDSDCDHLCLCNDDLHVLGNFVDLYAKAHVDLEVGMFCFCDFTPENYPNGHTYKWTTYPWRGYQVKMLPRFTGIMISVTRALIEKIGYFDAEFGQWGEEHSDFTIRARLAGGIKMAGQDMNCLDIEHSLLRHQDVPSSMFGQARARANAEANEVMQRKSREYHYRHYHRPFRLTYPCFAGGLMGSGIPVRALEEIGYTLVTDLV